jgi:hypothetical protein
MFKVGDKVQFAEVRLTVRFRDGDPRFAALVRTSIGRVSAIEPEWIFVISRKKKFKISPARVKHMGAPSPLMLQVVAGHSFETIMTMAATPVL